MGKISDALGRHKKERGVKTQIQKLKTVDYEALLQSDSDAGWLDLKHPLVTQDPGTVDRLLIFRLIDSNGFLTPAGKAKYIELNSPEPKTMVSKPIPISGDEVHRPESASDNKSTKVEKNVIETDFQVHIKPVVNVKLTQDECDVLMQYDRATGKLDITTQDVAIVRRLMNNKIIFDDGKLTSYALQMCKKLESKAIKASADFISNTGIPAEITEEQVGNEPAIPVVSKAAIEAGAKPKSEVTHKPLEAAMSDPVETTRQRPVVRAPAPRPSLPSSHNERMDPNLVSLFNPHSFEAEQFKILRSNLLFPKSGNPPRSVLVTSPHPGDGKSFVASNLAISVALNINRHVLLMDCDLRRPSIHTRFGFEDVPGLSDYLSNGAPLSDLLIRTSIHKLTILPGGQPPENPSELLSSDGMSKLLKETTDRYHDRLIIMDSPPPSMTAESSVLARWVDGVLIVINHGKTSIELLSDVIDRVGRDKIIGAIVNNFEVQSSRYYGKYYGKSKIYK